MPEPGREPRRRLAGAWVRELGRAGAAWWVGVALPALGQAAGRLREALARLVPPARGLAVRGAAVLLALGPAAGRAIGRLRRARLLLAGRRLGVLLRPGPVLAALPLALVGAALTGHVSVGGVVRTGSEVAAVGAGAWVAGACLAAGLAEAGGSAWCRAALAGGAGLVLGLAAHGMAFRLTPSLASWAVATSCLVALGLWGSRVIPEAHLLWAGPLAFLPVLGWEVAGGVTAQAPVFMAWWAFLLAAGHALVWAAGQAAPGGPLAVRLRLGAARLCHWASPFPLLGLVSGRPVGVAFVAGVVVANLFHQGGHLLADGDGSPPGPGLPVALALGGLAVAAGILVDAAGFPR